MSLSNLERMVADYVFDLAEMRKLVDQGVDPWGMLYEGDPIVIIRQRQKLRKVTKS